jgi:fucose 4-O-acetylase-like acetyltransferase
MMKKDIKLSNVKGVLIFLVVFGHVFEPFRDQYFGLYAFIYAFHMPLFIFVSGYFAKRVKISKIVNLMLLYLIFQTLFNGYFYLLGNGDSFTYETPQFHLWYLVSLGIWYTIAILLKKSKINKCVVLVTISGVAFGSRWYLDDIVLWASSYYEHASSFTLSYQRTLTFAPFFFIGYYMSQEHLTKVYSWFEDKTIKYMMLLSATLGIFFYAHSYPKILTVYWGSFGTRHFLSHSDDWVQYIFVNALHYGAAITISIILMNVISNRESLITSWGDRSLPIFLFHPIFTFYLWDLDFYKGWSLYTQIVFFCLISVLIIMFLSSKSFVTITNPLCSPYNLLSYKSIRKEKAQLNQ